MPASVINKHRKAELKRKKRVEMGVDPDKESSDDSVFLPSDHEDDNTANKPNTDEGLNDKYTELLHKVEKQDEILNSFTAILQRSAWDQCQNLPKKANRAEVYDTIASEMEQT